jgi:hypothetical protein
MDSPILTKRRKRQNILFRCRVIYGACSPIFPDARPCPALLSTAQLVRYGADSGALAEAPAALGGRTAEPTLARVNLLGDAERIARGKEGARTSSPIVHASSALQERAVQ